MPSSRRWRFTPEADADFVLILRYSALAFGPDRMDAYAEQLYRAFDDLAHFPSIGRARDELAPGLRSYPVGQHIAFYYATDDELIIIRIIHSRQDFEQEFRG
ncbi:MAG TPA: type II toxin-antitoxin system RelE/ParE family toxin [Thermomicrobiales bacterium]|nr:type II toxin-antitoxin system RelE/ParE family toxin [Thermomicrobiales bacterium]